ncbi:MAG: peptide chain release factor N(5)-glutamine methyltransferase [Chitinophagaceae bacterium]|nr:peptide chain release factor N(5)-glutamine methyltransferase [Chitinophagaceae bacterium]
MTFSESIFFVKEQLQRLYDESEASFISDRLLEHITGLPREKRFLKPHQQLTPDQQSRLQSYVERLLEHEPLQYVLQESWFAGMKFYVDQRVLIPRPETEELTEWLISHCRFPLGELNIIDIGTGSGCIAIVLKSRLKKATVWAADVSAAALEVARKNAEYFKTPIYFLQMNFLEQEDFSQLPLFDFIISNPPYISELEKPFLSKNVVLYEPHSALFVPGHDPLIFYKKLITFGKMKLKPGGMIFAEIHDNTGPDVLQLFQDAGYTAEIKKDMQGKERMVKGILS